MTVVVSPQARDDIDAAYHHLARDNPEAAAQLLARVAEIIGLLAAGGVEGRLVHLGDGRAVQTWPIPPYRLYYRKSADTFQVVRLYHQARRPIAG
jgi:plasmid stabilization system protein ParE